MNQTDVTARARPNLRRSARPTADLFRVLLQQLGGHVLYIDVTWHHDDPAYPVRLVSELDENRWEHRKLEFYRDGRVGKASKAGATLDTALGTEPIPSIEDINSDRQFSARPMECDAFEGLWLDQSQDKIG